MKRLLCMILTAALLCGFTGCTDTVPPATNGDYTTSPSSTADTTAQSEATEAFAETVTTVQVDPYEACPRIWNANCEEYINLRPAPGSSEVLAKLLPGDSMELLGWNGRYAKVRFNGQEGYVLSNYILPADGSALTDLLTVVRPTATYSYERMVADIAQLADAYPDRCATESIGSSEEGRAIPVLRIGDPNAKHHILVQGAIHGREHMTAWLVMALADFWLANDITGYADVCCHLIPMSNPDGVVISQSGELGKVQKEIYSHDRQMGNTSEGVADYAALWKANALGTDLNRNFPAGWEYLRGVNAPSSQRYPGDTPFSAAETAALRDYTLRYTFDSTISYHAYGSIIYYEYGNRQPVNEQSYSLAKAVQAVTGYPPEGSSSVEGGGYKDWVMDALGIPSLTIEIGCQPTPLEERELQSIFFRNLLVLPTVAQWLTK